MAKWNASSIRTYVQEHFLLYLFVGVLFIIGVVFGAVMVGALTLEQKEALAQHLGSFFNGIEQNGGVDAQGTFFQTLALNLKWLALIWVLGLSVIGLPLIFVLDFLKGVLIGFTVGFMSGEYAWKGVLFALVSVVPQNLIVIPALLVVSVTAVAFSLHLMKNRLLLKTGDLIQPFARYTTVTGAMALLVLGAALLEGFVSPTMMRWVTPMLMAWM